MELKEQLMMATMEEFNNANWKFTMDDLAKRLGVSKKTIYLEINNKDELIQDTVENFFRQLKLSERKIIEDDRLDVVEKLKRVIIAMPDNFSDFDFRQIAVMKEKYPKVYQKVSGHLGSEWEPTLLLYRQAVCEKKLRGVPEVVFKLMIEGSIKEFMTNPELVDGKVSYSKALHSMIDIMFEGLKTTKG